MSNVKLLTLRGGETFEVGAGFVYITQGDVTIVLSHDDWRQINDWIRLHAYVGAHHS